MRGYIASGDLPVTGAGSAAKVESRIEAAIPADPATTVATIRPYCRGQDVAAPERPAVA